MAAGTKDDPWVLKTPHARDLKPLFLPNGPWFTRA